MQRLGLNSEALLFQRTHPFHFIIFTTMKKLLFLPFLILAIVACGGNGKSKPDNKYLHEDDVEFAADASFEPIMGELSELFAMRHPGAEMFPHFVNEDSAIKMIIRDSVRLAIITRKLTEDEKNNIRARGHNVKQQLFAFDAFALIVNKNNPDTLINLNEIRRIVSGEITDWSQLEVTHKSGELDLVFDHSGSSTVRFMKDSLNNGNPIKGNVFAQGSNQAVIDMVRKHDDVIGVISTDWLRHERGDTAIIESFYDLDVKVMMVGRYGLKDELGIDCKDWQRPYQAYIATRQYPLFRGVYAVTTDSRPRSMLNNFYHFLIPPRGDGQRVICNSSQLLPYSGVQIRNVIVN